MVQSIAEQSIQLDKTQKPNLLKTLAYDKCFEIMDNMDNMMKKKTFNRTTMVLFISSFLNYNYFWKTDIFIYILSDILMFLNKRKSIHLFKDIYNHSVKFIMRRILNGGLYQNNVYLSNNFFSEILLRNIVEKNLTYYEEYYKIPVIADRHSYFKYTDGESVINPDFIQNFQKYTLNLFDDFDWTNCVVAGGLACKITDIRFNQNLKLGLYNSSDIDIFIYGKTKKKKAKIVYILNYLRDKLGNFYMINYSNVISLRFLNYHREIQLVIGNYKCPLQIINDFDLTHLQMYFDGKTLQGTEKNMEALRTRLTQITKKKITSSLVSKIYGSGFALRKDKFYYDAIEYQPDSSILESEITESIKNQYSILDSLCKHYCDKQDFDLTSIFFLKFRELSYMSERRCIEDNINYLSRITKVQNKFVKFINYSIDKGIIDKLTIDYTTNFTKSHRGSESFYDYGH